MKRPGIFFSSVLLLGCASLGWGEEPQYLSPDNAQLRRRLERLENAMEELRKATVAHSTPAAPATSSGPVSSGEDTKNLKQENVELKRRLKQLESALAGLANKETGKPSGAPVEPRVSMLSAVPQPTSAPVKPKEPTPVAKPQPASAPVEGKKPTEAPKPGAAPSGIASDKKSVLSSLDIEIYGIVKADASYDTSRTNPGNYVLYVDSEATRRNDKEFNLTANQTRLGLRVGGPPSETLKTSGLVEFDFYGNYASENKAKIQMRHAYVTLDWPNSQVRVLAGQTSDIISPLVPNTLNYTVLWDAGNIGYRRPQIRLTKSIPVGEKASVKLEGGLVRTIGRTDPTGSESGEDAGYPTVQARASTTFPFFGAKPATVGVSGHAGREEFDLDATGRHVGFESWSVNLDVTQPVCPWLTVLGEWFYGRNLDQYFGGIGQGVNTTTQKEIDATGGWVAASLGPWSQWSFNLGAGLDSADGDDVSNGGRTQNLAVFGNVFYTWNKNAQFGIELSRWSTRYKGSGEADALRAQTSFLYKF